MVVIAWSAHELAEVLGGTWHLPDGVAVPALIRGVARTDSREVASGDVFFALPGTVADGHDYVPAVAEAGAAVVIGARPVEAPVAQLLVADVLQALHTLARETVSRVKALGRLRVVAVTGSNGKTTTKNMLRAILERIGPTVAPQGSYNNHVGAPLSMLGVTEDAQFLIAELGASYEGEIARHAALCSPDIGIVLKVGAAHMGTMGGIEATTRAKTEMVLAIPASGTVILNADDPRVAGMAAVSAAPVRWFGTDVAFARGERTGIWAERLSTSMDGTTATLHWPNGQTRELRLSIIGEHHVHNALAALSAADVLGVDADLALEALAAMPRAERWRMEVLPRPDGVTIINDAYNASPDSMAAALRSLAALAQPGRRTVAVLGEMLDLGPDAVEEHDRIGRIVVRLNIGKLVVIGDGARPLHLAAVQEGSWDGESSWVATQEEAFDLLAEELRSGDVVLVKASGGVGLRYFGDRLAEVRA